MKAEPEAILKEAVVVSDPILTEAAKEALQGASAETAEPNQFEERIIQVDRVSRTQKGGRRIRFRALVIVGDKKGNVGMGIGKASEITAAVAKATYRAKKSTITVPIVRQTIPHEVRAKFDSAIIMLKPAAIGTSIIAGSSVRPILELAGVQNVVAKCLTRTTNKVNNAYATMVALQSLKDIRELPPRPYRKPKKTQATTQKTTDTQAKSDSTETVDEPVKKTVARKKVSKA